MLKNILLLLLNAFLSVLFLVVLITDNIMHRLPLELITVIMLIVNIPFTIAGILDFKAVFRKRRGKKLFGGGH